MLLQSAWTAGLPSVSVSDPEGTLGDNLKPGWTVHVTHDNRLYYCNHLTQTASWLPPADAWARDNSGGFPYGWEEAIDSDGKPYYINHVNKTTSYEDPRLEWTEEPPQPRSVELTRHPQMGFGFVAGSERPVIVRFVTEKGPSVGKLQPGDQLLSIDEEDVRSAPRDYVIQLVRSCQETVRLVVCQPPLDNSTRKSALLSSAKKAKLKSNPSRVRFAEGVVVNGSPLYTASAFSGGEGGLPLMPNVLKVFLENGQTKSFKYDSTTRVGDVVMSLQHKLCLKAIHHFSLVLEQVKSLRRNKLTLLNPEHTLARIASRPGSHNLRCLFRVAFVPRDACDLAQKDLAAFEYLYLQCCNDVVQERYAPELKYDIALRLAALHIHQHAISNNILPTKITVKSIEREFGLERFVPVSLVESMKRKELRKLLSHLLKMNQTMTGSSHKCLTSLQAKLYYLSIISELPSYGAKCFSTNIRDSNVETVILVSPKLGISEINGIRNSMPVPLADIEQLSAVRVQREDQISSLVTMYLPTVIQKEVSVIMEDRDADELVLVLQGYYRLLTGKLLPLQQENDVWTQDQAPLYHSLHAVRATRWSYAVDSEEERYANFTVSPPYHSVSITKHMRNDSGMTLTRSHSDVMQHCNNIVDNNMNNTLPSKFKERNGYCGIGYKPSGHRSKLGIDLQSVVSMEILESENGYVEARNDEVLKRVAEMQELVVNSEQYLTQHQRETSDSESSHISSQDSDHPGQLKHSDSLLLLSQGMQGVDSLSEAVQVLDLGETESDTDSISTPSSSPSHHHPSGKDKNRDSDSSFGLHSPDSLVQGAGQQALQELWRRLQEETAHLGYEMAGGSLYLDPDIIDLTLIPPPITPDREGMEYALPPDINLPPVPFADPSLLNIDPDTLGPEGKEVLSMDLDSFLATVTVPPPERTAHTMELTTEQISSFIIPPPPTTDIKEDLSAAELLSNGVTDNSPSGGRRVSFSCCSKPRQQSPTNTPPSRPPKPNSSCPPSLPPRSDSISSATLSRKPPLPPVTPQEVALRFQPAVREACTVVEDLCEQLGQVAAQCNADQAHGGGANIDEACFQDAKEALTLKVRKLVTSSKLLVRSSSTANANAAPASDCLAHLNDCLALLWGLTDLSGNMAAHTSSPLHTRNLVLKVQDVVAVFKDLLATDGQEALLTKQAENLASVLAALLRSLRVFTP